MKYIHYYQQGWAMMQKINRQAPLPTLLLHVCCAPCATYPLEYLISYFQVSIYYENSNIYPHQEYQRRLLELQSYVNQLHPDVKVIVPPYEPDAFLKKLSIRKDDKEGKARCKLCFYLRMDASFAYADQHGFDYFATALTISRQKDEQAINRIGFVLQKRYPNTIYLPHDFKKKQGIDRTVSLSKQHQLYRQDYCGCFYSYQQSKSK